MTICLYDCDRMHINSVKQISLTSVSLVREARAIWMLYSVCDLSLLS
jgi:hypothetical protein